MKGTKKADWSRAEEGADIVINSRAIGLLWVELSSIPLD